MHAGLIGGPRSKIDDPAFFLSPAGKTDPRAELHATLAGYFEPPGEDPLSHARCRFPARFSFLESKLGLNAARLPVPACDAFDAVQQQLDPTSITLVFPSAYINSPASMFGHTLLVFDSASHDRLISKALSYAAVTGQSFGPAFAVSGILGLYPGYYTVQPYHEKVQSYNAISHRDLWEYELNLNAAEVDTIFRHAWELQNIYSDYFFFSENCSGNLLDLLDVSRPEIRLADQFRYQVIPVDVVRAVNDAGLVRDVTYRPSTATTIRELGTSLSHEARSTAVAMAHGKNSPSNIVALVDGAAERIAILDLAALYAQYLYTQIVIDPPTYRARYLSILRARSRLGRADGEAGGAAMPARPETGHRPGRVGVGAGTRDGDPYQAVRLRMAYHTLTDRDTGYERGAHVQFFDLEGRYNGARDGLELERLLLAEVISISPRDDLFKPVSWRFGAGLGQMKLTDNSDQLVFKLDSGSGLAWHVGDPVIAYVMLEGALRAGSDLPADYAVGAGVAAGVLASWGNRSKSVLRLASRAYGFAETFEAHEISLTQSIYLRRNAMLSLEISATETAGYGSGSAGLFAHAYF